jgi:AcrR family transcriptional regulator
VSHKNSLAPTDGDARTRITAAALRCFARNGFAGTSLADIETEAGFSVGAGSTYRYFPSKQAMLEAAVVDALQRADDLAVADPVSIEEAGRLALTSMGDIQDLTRIVLRDLDRFPELLMPVVDRLIEGPVRAVGAHMSSAAPGIDGEAMATLLIGALVNVKVIEALGGQRPGAIDHERLLTAWTRLYRLALENPT